jgi:hypothetical protein
MIRTTTSSQSTRVEGLGQTMDYTEHVTMRTEDGRHKLRVLIHLDTYTEQAWARIERWDGTKWHAIASMRGSSLKTPLNLGYVRDLQPAEKVTKFKTDRDTLLKLAEEVL